MNGLIIGLGSIGKKHLAALQQVSPGVTMHALRSSADAAIVDNVTNISSYDQLTIRPDFVIVSNPTSLHRPAIMDAMRFQSPLFIEKPAVADPAEAEEILSLVRQQRILTYVACNLRFHPVIKFIRHIVQDKKPRINEVNIYCGSYLPDWRPAQDYTASYSASDSMGGGVQLDLIHEIDYAYWLFGAPEKVMSIKRKVSSLKITSNDFAAYHLSYPGFTVNIVLNYYRKDAKRSIELVHEEGTIHANLLAGNVKDEQGNNLFSSDDTIASTYVSQMQYFIDHIKKGTQPMNDLAEAVEILKIAVS